MKRLLVVATVAIALAAIPAPSVVAKGAPRNDDFDRARSISALPFSSKVNIKHATQAQDDPSCRDSGHTVWFKFTPGTDVRLMARVRGRKDNGVISVWTGQRGALTEVECGDYRPIFDATAGATYFFMVGTYRNRRGGDIRFRLSEAPPPPTVEMTVDPVVSVNPQTEEVTVGGTITCTNSDYTYFYGSVRQLKDDRSFISAFFYSDDQDCDATPVGGTSPSWATASSSTGRALLRSRPTHATSSSASRTSSWSQTSLLKGRSAAATQNPQAVELPGIEPGSPDPRTGLLRA
jgi:hypothetical protein